MQDSCSCMRHVLKQRASRNSVRLRVRPNWDVMLAQPRPRPSKAVLLPLLLPKCPAWARLLPITLDETWSLSFSSIGYGQNLCRCECVSGALVVRLWLVQNPQLDVLDLPILRFHRSNLWFTENFSIEWSSPERYEIFDRVGGGKYSEVCYTVT